MHLLAESTEADMTPTGIFLSEDAAVQGVTTQGRYYVEVSDTAGGSGVDHFYTLTYGCYTASANWLGDPEPADFGTSTDPSAAELVPFTVSTTSENFFAFGRFYGDFDRADSNVDDYDAFAIADHLEAGRYVNVELESAAAGATTGDVTLTLYHNQGGGNYVELVSDTGPDPKISNYQLQAGQLALLVTVTSDGTEQGRSTGYYGLALVTADAQ